MTVSSLQALITSKNQKKDDDVLIVDTRPLMSYHHGHLANAISVALPVILWRRFLKNLHRPGCLDDFLMGDNQQLRRRREASMIVLYDDTTVQSPIRANPQSPLAIFCKYFVSEGIKVRYLVGGFAKVEAIAPPSLIVRSLAAPVDAEASRSPVCRKRNFCSTEFSFINGFIAVGSEEMGSNPKILKAEGITHILNLTAKECPPDVQAAFACLRIELKDSLNENLFPHFKVAFDFIERARLVGGRVLVHCVAGVSRSVAMVAGYLMWRHKMSMTNALALVQAHRPCASPNLNFIGQLMALDKEMPDTPSSSVSLSVLPRMCMAARDLIALTS